MTRQRLDIECVDITHEVTFYFWRHGAWYPQHAFWFHDWDWPLKPWAKPHPNPPADWADEGRHGEYVEL